MEVATAAQLPPSGSGCSSSSSAAYPRWVILECRCKSNVDDYDSFCAAAARTSNGIPIQISLSLAEPPATSVVRVNTKFSDSHDHYCIVIAAHSDSLLVAVNFIQGDLHLHRHRMLDYLVYNAGDAAADPPRPPSLLLLPHYYLRDNNSSWYPGLGSPPVNRYLDARCTGILHPRRGDDDEVVVAELMMVPVKTVSKDKDTGQKTKVVTELFLFRSGAWSVQRPRICFGNDDGDEHGDLLLSKWRTNSVVPIGDRILCWVQHATTYGGILVCDVLEESPCLKYVPLPSVPTPRFDRNVCATAGGGTLKFVNICPRCCCGDVGESNCQSSHHAYTIDTWTLRMDSMEWVKDGMVDATELWSLDAYKGLPRVPLLYPVVSLYESHVICFSLCENYHLKYGVGDKTLWLLTVDMRSKTIQSVARHPDQFCRQVLSSNISYYLNPYPTCSSGDGTSMANEKKKKKKRDDLGDGTNPMLRSPCMSTRPPTTEPAAAQASEILAAFQEIPSYGLTRDDMLKAYGILSSDNGCRVRSLLKLPMKLRKDWLLMEIKADNA